MLGSYIISSHIVWWSQEWYYDHVAPKSVILPPYSRILYSAPSSLYPFQKLPETGKNANFFSPKNCLLVSHFIKPLQLEGLQESK